jgi:hypothetical protein
MGMNQAWDQLKELHQGLVNLVGNDTAAKAIEASAGLLVLLLLVFYLRWQFSSQVRRERGARKRFNQLARAHHLPASDRQILQTMARRVQLDEPGLIFVRRSLFETAASSGGLDPDRVDVLRRELYS